MNKIIFLTFLFLVAFTVGFSTSNRTSKVSKKTQNTRAPNATTAKEKYPTLEFLELKQFPIKNRKIKFDLSGLAQHSDGSIYAISDKQLTPFIYKVDWKSASLIEEIPFGIKDKLDIEAIDICQNSFYLSNEKNDKFYIVEKDQETRTLSIDVSAHKRKNTFFNSNVGFEGMALDCENQTMYVTKEMLPRFILTIDLKTNTVLKRWSIPETDTFDFTDAKYQSGYLYVLERSAMLVAKIDVKTEKVVAKYSYKNIEQTPGYLFGPAPYSQAEALLLTKDEIWIGFDNNGLKATEKAQKELGLKGRDPLIVRFKRPSNF